MSITRRWGRDWRYDHQYVNHAAFRLVTPPAVPPVSLLEVKRYLRIDFDNDDPLLDTMIEGATSRLEAWLRRALITQTWDVTLDWGPSWIETPYPPLQSVTGIYVKQLDLTEAVVDPSVYYVNTDARMVGLRPASVWPVHLTPFGFRVRFVAGYGDDPGDVPAAIKLQLYNMVSFAYENRSTIDEVPESTRLSLRSYRIEGAPWRMSRHAFPPEFLA